MRKLTGVDDPAEAGRLTAARKAAEPDPAP